MLQSLGYVCAVQVGGERSKHPTDPAALHMFGPGFTHGMVLRRCLYPLCHVQEGTGTGKL